MGNIINKDLFTLQKKKKESTNNNKKGNRNDS